MRDFAKKTPWIVKGFAVLALATMATACPDDDLGDEIEDEVEDIGDAIDGAPEGATTPTFELDPPHFRS